MLQDLQIPSHTHSATGLGRMAAEATVCMSLIIVAVQHNVLCVCVASLCHCCCFSMFGR